uniref:Uncharacterized protein n=1 Tax=Plectus sambesii TaxID=2011161 RepID=A0A914WFC6_9BILA
MEEVEASHGLKTFVREMELNSGVCLTVHQQCVGDVGGVVWDSALATCKLLELREEREPHCFVGKRVLELGAGTGVCSLLLASLGAQVTATDLDEQLDLLRLNVSVNETHFNKSGGSMRVEALDWNCEQSLKKFSATSFDMILIVDCVYYESSVQPLIDTICALASAHTEILCAYEERNLGQPQLAQKRFFEQILSHFVVERVPVQQQHPDYVCEDIHLLTFHQKK